MATAICTEIPSLVVTLSTQRESYSDLSETKLNTLMPVFKAEHRREDYSPIRSLEEAVAQQASGIEVRALPDYGRCLFASSVGQTIIEGTDLICEEPLLQVRAHPL